MKMIVYHKKNPTKMRKKKEKKKKKKTERKRVCLVFLKKKYEFLDLEKTENHLMTSFDENQPIVRHSEAKKSSEE